MKMKKAIIRTLIVMMVAILGIGSIIPSFASKNIEKNLSLSYFRYANGEKKYGYALSVEGIYPVFQIMSSTTDTDYYCLNASVGDAWRNGHIGGDSTSTYNMEYDLDSDIEGLKSNTNDVYSNIGKSQYLKQILWILDNIYISDKNLSEEENLAKKRELLAKAGLIYGAVDIADENYEGYRYIAQPKYDYSNIISDQGKNGYFYFDVNDQYIQVELPEEMVSVAQQAALWYFTNYLENNDNNNQVYNVRENILKLSRTLDKEVVEWYGMGSTNNGHPFNHTPTNVSGKEATIEEWQQEMATVLCWYLIDTANNYATSENTTRIPLTITPAQSEANKKTVNNIDYYVVGPVKIEGNQTGLNNVISVNGDTTTGAYISNAEGTKNKNQVISNYIGKDFYISIPKSKVTGNNIQITFDGTYKINEKKLLISTTKTEQPVVEVKPKDIPFELKVNAPIKKEFDLALRKVITKITSADGTKATIINEKGLNAERTVNIDTSTIPNTATYKHRKDPVVVKKGDIVTYSITVYNEGEIDGYAKTIVDKLPQGLALKGFTANKTTTGTYKKGNINYSYVYNKDNNTITFTNVSENVLSKFEGTLASETIEIECEVTQEPSTKTNNYLTNIAYISEAYKKETDTPEKVENDRDSSTKNNPQANQNTTGDKYTGYHGGNDTKNIYNDTDNTRDYFEGQEDDDDFEIVVIKPAEFDLALQKYIESVVSPDGTTKSGRNAPTIDTSKLIPNGTEKTANYTLDKTPITVKSGDFVLYNFTVYNEGEVDGYVNKITDNIPTGLEFVYIPDSNMQQSKTITKVDSQGNSSTVEVSDSIYQKIIEYNSYWELDQDNNGSKKDNYNGENTTSITYYFTETTGKKFENKPNQNKGIELKAYDSSKDSNFDGEGLDRTSVQVLLRVSAPNGTVKTIRNEAAITEATDKEGNIQDVDDVKDRDSQTKPSDNTTDPWPGKDGDKNYQDDEDYDNIILEKVDLALTKFITAISEDEKIENGEYLTANKNVGSNVNPYDRATKVDTTPLKNGEHDAKYTQVKTSLTIPERSYVLYNIRVYNEGDVDVYAGEVTDYLPEYLSFVQGEFNDQFRWHSSDGKTVTTDYLSYKVNKDKALKAFDKEADDGKGSKLDYKDLPILCRIKADTPDKTKLINSAEITKYEDENGTPIDTDIDSKPENLPDDKKNKEGKPEGRYDEDDEDYEVVEVKKKIVDLALTKFITAISEDEKIENGEYLTANKNIGSNVNPYDRATKVDTTPLKNGEHDAKYTQIKTPLTIPENSYILYNIRVYNEGEVDVFAGEVKDYLPDYLEFVSDDAEKFNEKYGWKLSSDGKTVTTNYLSAEVNKDKILKAFDKETDDGKGSKLDYQDLPILCRIKASAPDKTRLINSAEITKYENKNGNKIDEDIDSKPENLPDDKKNKEGKPEGRYNEDDEDYEIVEVKKKIVDLALTKFIAAISNDVDISDGEYLTPNHNVGSKENPYDRATEVKTDKLKNDPNCHDAEYIMVKDPLTVPAQSYVLYNIRVYNEGETDVYAGEVTDHLPDYLDYVDCEFNKKFGWTVASDGKTISTKYLSYEVNKDKILKAFNKKDDDEHGSGLDYEDLQILCKVNDKAPTNTNIVNIAEITKYENKNGNPIPDEDIDSKPGNVDKNNEDDDDYETILIKTFDLSLLKYVSEVYVTEDGKTTTTQTGNTGDNSKDIIPKVEINKKKLNSTVVKFGYTIKITNEGDIEGYAKEITDYVPEGLKFYEEDNTGWKDEGNGVISTRLLENTLLKPGESAEVKVIFRWINGSNNLGLKTNVAEISEDYNKEGVPDRDSTPDNKEPKEDDIDEADVILSIKTGLASNIIMYVTAGTIILTVLGVGIFTIKKYVL